MLKALQKLAFAPVAYPFYVILIRVRPFLRIWIKIRSRNLIFLMFIIQFWGKMCQAFFLCFFGYHLCNYDLFQKLCWITYCAHVWMLNLPGSPPPPHSYLDWNQKIFIQKELN